MLAIPGDSQNDRVIILGQGFKQMINISSRIRRPLTVIKLSRHSWKMQTHSQSTECQIKHTSFHCLAKKIKQKLISCTEFSKLRDIL